MSTCLLVVIDGLSADALSRVDTPCLDELMSRASYTFTAKTVAPSGGLPAHFSMLTAVSPEDHGVLSNSANPVQSSHTMGLFDLVYIHGKRLSAFYSWEHLRNLWAPGTMDHSFFLKSQNGSEADLSLARSAAGYVNSHSPDLCYLYLGNPDRVEQACGNQSKQYLAAVTKADQALGQLLHGLGSNAFLETGHIIVLSSTQQNNKHENNPKPKHIPWLVAGPKIKSGHQISSEVDILDTAPTMAGIMDLPALPAWRGKMVSGVFK